MASDKWYLWAFSYAIGEQGYTCPFYFKNRDQAEGRIKTILSCSPHIKRLDLQECTEGMSWFGKQLPYERKRLIV